MSLVPYEYLNGLGCHRLYAGPLQAHDLIVALGIVEPPEKEEYDEPDYEDYI